MIKGIEHLTEQQIDIMVKTNEKHRNAVGNDYKNGMDITKVWIDEDGILCVKLKNNSWYHYTDSHTWY